MTALPGIAIMVALALFTAWSAYANIRAHQRRQRELRDWALHLAAINKRVRGR